MASVVGIHYSSSLASIAVVTKGEFSSYNAINGRLHFRVGYEKLYSGVRGRLQTGEHISSSILDDRQRKAILGTSSGMIGVFNLETGLRMKMLDPSPSGDLISQLLYAGERTVISCSWDGRIRVYDENDEVGHRPIISKSVLLRELHFDETTFMCPHSADKSAQGVLAVSLSRSTEHEPSCMIALIDEEFMVLKSAIFIDDGRDAMANALIFAKGSFAAKSVLVSGHESGHVCVWSYSRSGPTIIACWRITHGGRVTSIDAWVSKDSVLTIHASSYSALDEQSSVSEWAVQLPELSNVSPFGNRNSDRHRNLSNSVSGPDLLHRMQKRASFAQLEEASVASAKQGTSWSVSKHPLPVTTVSDLPQAVFLGSRDGVVSIYDVKGKCCLGVLALDAHVHRPLWSFFPAKSPQRVSQSAARKEPSVSVPKRRKNQRVRDGHSHHAVPSIQLTKKQLRLESVLDTIRPKRFRKEGARQIEGTQEVTKKIQGDIAAWSRLRMKDRARNLGLRRGHSQDGRKDITARHIQARRAHSQDVRRHRRISTSHSARYLEKKPRKKNSIDASNLLSDADWLSITSGTGLRPIPSMRRAPLDGRLL